MSGSLEGVRQNETLLTLGPMARRLRVPAQWLRSEAESGAIPCVRAGRAILFHAETVEGVLLERARTGDEPSERGHDGD